MRIPSLAVSAAFSIALTGCDPGPGASLQGEALTGHVRSSRYTRETDHDVAFFIDDLDLDNCPRVDAGGVTFEGEVNEFAVGGRREGYFTDTECRVVVGFALDANDGDSRDGRLDIVHVGDTLTYVGENLVGERRFIPQDGLTATAGGTLRFRYEPSSDITSQPAAWLRTDPTVSSFDLSASKDNGDIIVSFPDDTPAGQHTLNMRFDLEINTVVCEGFSSCALTGLHFEQIAITVQ